MTPIDRARLSLDGLSVGDALGAQFFVPRNAPLLFGPRRDVPPPVWPWTDDTAMALSVVSVLERHGRIDPDALAEDFARRFDADSLRGYGVGMVRLLGAVHDGASWRDAAPRLFNGQGSLGNGAAMRVAPLGGFFADDLEVCVEEARQASAVTHAHPDGVAGGVAVAVAAAMAWRLRDAPAGPESAGPLWDEVLARTPPGSVHNGLTLARTIPPDTPPGDAVYALGNGSSVRADDTVPLVVWMCARHLHQFAEAVWQTIRCGGDIDTTAAMVGGVTALACGRDGLPADWLAAREPFEGYTARDWIDGEDE